MKIDVYQEQYKSKQAQHEPGKIGFGFDPSIIKTAGDALISASIKKMEQDDAINSARIEADTVHEADKMLQNYKATANPDDFVGDMERQQRSIQTLIKDQSKGLKTRAAQTAFMEKMTRGLEEKYVGDALQYSYQLQATNASKKVAENLDSLAALMLDGNTLVTPYEIIQRASQYVDEVAAPYHLTKQQIDKMKHDTNQQIIVSYVQGILDKDPDTVHDILVGNSFDKFATMKEEAGEAFTMEEFWASPELQEEYRNSEYGASWVNISEYLDYPTRMQLFGNYQNAKARVDAERQKQMYADSAMAQADLEEAQQACELQADSDGTIPSQWATPKTLNLGSVGEPVHMGKAQWGPIDKSKGRYVTPAAKTFMDGIAGNLYGYEPIGTSSARPDSVYSKHKDGSAVDAQAFKTIRKNGKVEKQLSLDGMIKMYATAVKLYGNNMRKGGTLFEVDPNKLSYIKAELTRQGIPLDYVDWKQSETEGAKALADNRQHIHFGIDPKADYTKTASGTGESVSFRYGIGEQWFNYYKLKGKSDKEAYAEAKQQETKIAAKQYAFTLMQRIVTGSGQQGPTDPALFPKLLVQARTEISGNSKLSDSERIIRLKAVDYLESELPKAMKLYEEDPAGFVNKYYGAKNGKPLTPKQNAAIQQNVYGIAANEIRTMSEAEAKVEAATIERLSGEEFVRRAENYSVSDIKSIASNMSDEDKSGLFLYLSMASPKGKQDIQQAVTSLDETKKFIDQMKNDKSSTVFGKGNNWRANVQAALLNNKIVDGYLKDLEKTEPQARTHFITAMTALYAYRASKKGRSGDMNTIMNDMVQDIIGDSINTLTVRSPFWGNTTVNISRQAYNENETRTIKEMLDFINGMGLNPNKATAYDAQALVTNDEILDKTAKVVLDKTNQVNHEANARSAVLHGTLDGKFVAWTYGDVKKSPYSGKFMRDENGRKMQMSLSDLLEIDKQAKAMVASWKNKNNEYYTIPGSGAYTSAQTGYDKYNMAYKAAIAHLLSNKYPWLNQSQYTKFKRLEVVPDKQNHGYTYYEVEYNEQGKEIHRKRTK